MDSNTAAAKRPLKQEASTANKAYLIFYNFLSAVQWSVVLGRTAILASAYGPEYVYPNIGQFTKWTQTLAGRRPRFLDDYSYAGRLAFPARLGHRRCIPLPRPLALLFVHAHRLVRHRDYPLFFLRSLAVRLPAQVSYLVAL
ncbi:hypothetical protein LB505_000054 [Fusarium chuoi]|nr:hypothetical protein LB505_000054 [Fusarium chuoi]